MQYIFIGMIISLGVFTLLVIAATDYEYSELGDYRHIYKYKVRFVEYTRGTGNVYYGCEFKQGLFWRSIYYNETLEGCKKGYEKLLAESLERKTQEEREMAYNKTVSKKVIE